MNIAMIVSNNIINDIRVLKEARELASEGHSVYVFGISDSSSNVKEIASNVTVITVKHNLFRRIYNAYKAHGVRSDESKQIILGANLFCKMKNKFLNLLKGCFLFILIEMDQLLLFNKIKRYGIAFNAVHCHDLDVLKVGYLYKKKQKVSLIYDSHELWTEMSGINSFIKKWFSRKEKKYLGQIDYLITVSPSIANEIEKRYSYKGPISIVRNIPFPSKREMKVSIPNPQSISVVYVGYYLRGRGVENILEAASNFNKNILVHLKIQDDENIQSVLAEKIKKLDLMGRVYLQKFVPQDDLIEVLSEYDIGLLPYVPLSLNNAFCLPNKLFQYLSAGLCVVSNELPEVKKILNYYQCGITYNESSTKKTLIKVINFLSQNPEVIYRLKNNARLAMKTDLNWEKERIGLLKIYRGISI